MYAYFQPKMSVEQEEADIKEMIDEEYERKEQEERDYYKQMEEDYYKHLEEDLDMTQEDKELLLKDLCARLANGVIVETPKGKGHVCDINLTIFGTEIGVNVNSTVRDTFSINDVKPYIFPLSSMTEEQEDEWYEVFIDPLSKKLDRHTRQEYLRFQADAQAFGIEYLLKNHFDYGGLIENGLAIDATGLNIY